MTTCGRRPLVTTFTTDAPLAERHGCGPLDLLATGEVERTTASVRLQLATLLAAGPGGPAPAA
jgi:hypothetical protein